MALNLRAGQGNIKMSNPTLVDDCEWWRPLERFPLGTPACTSATTVPTRNYTKPQSKHFSAMFTLQHTSLTIEEKKRRGYWKEERFRGDRKWEKERNARKQKAGIQLVTANVLCQRVNQKLCLCVWSRRWRDVSLSDAPTPPSEMFIWTRAMNPWLLKGGWRGRRRRRRRWRPAAPIIICGFGVRSTAYNEALDGPPDRVH